MIRGIQLSLMVGPAIAIPAPREVVEAVESIKVHTHAGDQQSGFEIVFAVEKGSVLETLFLLSSGAMLPIVRVILVVTLDGQQHTLIDGVMTHHQIAPGSGGEPSKLTVQGKDLSAVMDLFDFNGIPYPAMPAFARVALVLAKYAALGVIPKTIPSFVEDLPIPTERIPRHQGTDRAYCMQLATEAGYVFYMEPGPAPGMSFAYWGPEIKVGSPQKALSVDFDAHTNVSSLSFSLDTQSKELPVVFIQNKETKAPIPIPIPDVTPLNPPLGAVPPIPPKITPLDDTARLTPAAALMRGIAHAVKHGDVVTAQGELDVLRYGGILKSRGLVGVRGAGMAFDGYYYVSSVTHNLTRGSYTQSFTLKRNGILPTTSVVAA